MCCRHLVRHAGQNEVLHGDLQRRRGVQGLVKNSIPANRFILQATVYIVFYIFLKVKTIAICLPILSYIAFS